MNRFISEGDNILYTTIGPIQTFINLRPSRVKKAGVCVKLWLAGIYFLVYAIFVASKLWIWQQFNFLAGQLPAFIETVCLAK